DHFRRLRPHVHEALHPQPLVTWYGSATFTEGPRRAALTELLEAEDDDGVRRRVILEDDARLALGEGAASLAAAAPRDPVFGSVLVYDTNRVVVQVDAPAAGVVVLNDALYPGWKVRVDGEARSPFFANTFVRG